AGGPRSRGMFRSRRHKVVAGVCGGLGRHFGVDPVIFRVPLAVLSLIGGVGFVAYGIAWLVLPYEDEEENEARRLLTGRVEGAGLTALLFVLVGLGLLLASMSTRLQFFSVLVLGSMVAAAHWSQQRGWARTAGVEGPPVDPVTAQTVATAPPEAQPPPAPVGPSWWRSPSRPCAAPSAAGGDYLWGPKDALGTRAATGAGGARVNMRKATDPPEPVAAGHGAAPGWPPGAGAGRSPYPYPAPAFGGYAGGGHPFAPSPGADHRPARPRGFWLGGPVLLAAITAAVLVTGAVWHTVALGPALTYGFAAALAVFGLGLVLGAFVGRMGAGTVIAATMTAVLLLAASVLPRGIETEWRDEYWSPVAAAEVAPSYRAGTAARL
ncbi:PspC domain-containing protein, partial [Streptomyces sp. IF17]|nr:PspC domain-containing protein [Streptomyces alkaliphilus]